MRKFLLTALAICLTFGLGVAAEVVFLKFDADTNEVTVKEGDSEKVYKVTDSTKLYFGEKEAKGSPIKMLSKAKEGKAKFDITADGDTLTAIKVTAKKKKDKND